MPREVTTPLLLTGAAATPTDPRHVPPRSYVDQDLPEAKVDAPVAYTAAVAADALLWATTRLDTSGGAIDQPIPAALPGRRFRIGQDAGSAALRLVAAGSDVIGAGSATAIQAPSTRGMLELRCTVTGRWRVTGGYIELDTLDARYLGSRRSVATDTTAVAAETLWVTTGSSTRTIGAPLTPPAPGQRIFVGKADSGSGAVLLAWTISGDPDGVRITAPGAGVTLLYDGAAYWVESTSVVAVTAPAAGGRAPASAGPRGGFYDPPTNSYWPSGGSGRLIRAHLARASLPTSPQLVDMVCAGDSRTAGSNIPGGTPADAWPSQIRARLAAAGIPSAGTGLVMACNGVTLDARIVLAGTWSSQYPYRAWGATGATATFTSDAPGTVVEVYYYSNSGTFTVKVDSAAAVTVTPAGGGTNVAKYTVSGLANTAHTVTVTSTSASGSLIGFCVRGTSGLLVHPVAVGGIISTQLAATGANTLQQIISFLNPSILGVMVGTNDPANSVPASTLAANLTAVCQTNNPTAAKFLVVETPYDAQQAAWPPYVSAQYDQADALGCALLDLNDRFVTPALGNAAGLLGSDLLHETITGGQDVARAVTRLIAA